MRGAGPLDALLQRLEPTLWEQFRKGPALFLARVLYSWRRVIPYKSASPVTVVCVSDTHNRQVRIPAGDILIHAGDLTESGSYKELRAALDWLDSQPHRHKIVVAGNHDWVLSSEPSPSRDRELQEKVEWGSIIYLQDESTTIQCQNGRELKIYGSPQSPRHGNWPFQYPRTQDVWKGVIPLDTDILITHTPPRAHLDVARLGCDNLLRELWQCRPRLHVFGHAHAGYGTEWLQYDPLQRAYEQTMREGGGLWNLVDVVSCFVRAMFTTPRESRSLLVNAAIVGGLRDERLRDPVVVQI